MLLLITFLEMYAASSHWDEVELYIRDLKERNITVNSRLAKALVRCETKAKIYIAS